MARMESGAEAQFELEEHVWFEASQAKETTEMTKIDLTQTSVKR